MGWYIRHQTGFRLQTIVTMIIQLLCHERVLLLYACSWTAVSVLNVLDYMIILIILLKMNTLFVGVLKECLAFSKSFFFQQHLWHVIYDRNNTNSVNKSRFLTYITESNEELQFIKLVRCWFCNHSDDFSSFNKGWLRAISLWVH